MGKWEGGQRNKEAKSEFNIYMRERGRDKVKERQREREEDKERYR